VKKNMILLYLGLCGLGCYVYIHHIKKVNKVTDDVVIKNDIAPKMHKYCLNKLWRDKAAADLEKNDGAIIHRHILNDDEYRMQLGLKLKEEAAEVEAAKNKEELIEEIGDVLEVLDCIIILNNLDKQEIENVQKNKRDTRGSYLAREFITIVQAVDGGYLHNYYLKSPDRHQEIFD